VWSDPVTVDDVRSTFEVDIPAADEPRVSALIAKVGRRVEERVGDLNAWVWGAPARAAVLADVVVDVVQSVLRAPGPYNNESEGGYAYSLDTTVASLRVDLSPGQWARLFSVGGPSAVPGFGSSRVGIPAWSGRRW
jgi:hypothetical protein